MGSHARYGRKATVGDVLGPRTQPGDKVVREVRDPTMAARYRQNLGALIHTGIFSKEGRVGERRKEASESPQMTDGEMGRR
jgi:hypothetical protein